MMSIIDENSSTNTDTDPWLDSSIVSQVRISNSKFDVLVSDIEISNNPVRVRYSVSVGSLNFYSLITYHSISEWDQVDDDSDRRNLVLSTVVAWDAMRFLMLGGEKVVLPSELNLTRSIVETWKFCFLRQFGEWRFRNRLQYSKEGAPELEVALIDDLPIRQDELTNSPERWLLTNGGGKDTLTGMLLMNEADVHYDLYEGFLPTGGSAELQQQLLMNLRTAVSPNANMIAVTIEDDFFNRSSAEFIDAGVEVEYYKTDFFVGHTANYAGAFPVIMHHGYSRMWFNIERSADDVDVMWNDEEIRHQWCKNSEYQELMTKVLSEIRGDDFFHGFGSTVRSLHDTTIYEIVANEPEALKRSHSCNYGKPWCGHCPKCLFCYLMMSARLGEAYAQEVLGVQRSLFEAPELGGVWKLLFAPDSVAWECVASKEECALALGKFAKKNDLPAELKSYVPTDEVLTEFEIRYNDIDWETVPEVLATSLHKLLEKAY